MQPSRVSRPVFVWLACATHAVAQVITTVAGTAFSFPSQPLPAIYAPLGGVEAIAFDAKGNVYVTDYDTNLVLQIAPDGTLTVVAGNGTQGFSGDGGPATSASLNGPVGIAVDSAGNLYIGDSYNSRVRKVSGGIITTIAGNGAFDFSGDGGPATSAALNPSHLSVAVDSAGSVYFNDGFNNRIRKVSGGIITTVAGNGAADFAGDGGAASDASLNLPSGIALDSAGNLYIADTNNSRIRKVSRGVITTVAGNGRVSFSGDGGPATSAAFKGVVGIGIDSVGNLYIADGERIRKVAGGIITTVAGGGSQGFSGDGGLATSATLNLPQGVAVNSAGNLYIADSLNFRVRAVSGGMIQTVAGTGQFKFSGDGGPATSAALHAPAGIAIDSSGNVYIADFENLRIREVNRGRIQANASTIISTIAGNGTANFSGDGGPATSAEIFYPTGVALDSAGNLYIADSVNNRIRKVSGGIITTVAGNGRFAFSGDGGPATSASLNQPGAIAFDSSGNLYISDVGNNRIRKVTGGTITTIAGNGDATPSGDGGPAISAGLSPQGISIDSDGNIYVADFNNNLIRKISGGLITTVAGTGAPGFSGDGGPATSAALNGPYDVAVDSAGNLYIADYSNNRVRKVSSGIITTLAGNGGGSFSGDGGPASDASLNGPEGIAVDSAGNVYVADSANDRIREVLNTSSTFQATPASLSFSAPAGGPPTASQAFTLSSSLPGLPFSASASASWLSVTPSSGTMPASLQVVADPSNLSAGAYTGMISITAPGASPSTQNIAVAFSVSATISGNLAVSANSLVFAFTQGASPATQQVTISNRGSGSIRYAANASTTPNLTRLSVSGNNGSVSPDSPATLAVTITPGTLGVGSYFDVIAVTSPDTGQQFAIPVTLAISAPPQKILLSQVGFTFVAVAQGGSVLPQSLGILNIGSGTLNYTVQTVTQPGTPIWLRVSASSGTVIRPFLDVSTVDISVDASSLAPGTYYGQVNVSATAASNSPQTALVILKVLPPGSNPGPVVRPTGLIFTGVAGAESPGSQNVTVANITGSPITYGSSIAYPGSSKGWIKYLPADATVAPSVPVRIVVQPDFTSLTEPVYFATLNLAFLDNSYQTIRILAVLAPAGTSPGTSAGQALAEGDRGAGSCTATKLLPQFTQVGFGSTATVNYPAVVAVKVVDDCGLPLTDGSVVVSFSNGDAPLSLVSLQDGNWTNSWQPGHGAGAVTLGAVARPPSMNLIGTAPTITVGLQQTNLNPPVLSGLPAGAFAPGDVVLLQGVGLADGAASSTVSPLSVQLAGASVLIGGRTASLLYADAGQVLALVPPDLPLNTSQQVIVQRDVSLGLPVPVIISAAHPAVLTKDGSGQGQGIVYAARPGATTLADASNPVKSGDNIIVYCTGLGTTDATGTATNLPQLIIGGQPAQVSYAGVARAANYPPAGAPTVLGGLGQVGLGGLYQITATVPGGLPGGPAAILVTSAGQSSTSGVTLAIAGAAGSGPVITSINTAYGSSDIGQNDFIEIHGTNLASATTGPASLTAQLGGATVTVDGKPALLYYVSPNQVNALTPLDNATGLVPVAVNNGAANTSFTANLRTVTPAFLRFDAGHITAAHADGSYLGPTTLGPAFTPAKRGETIVTYAVGFGLPSTTLVSGSASQSGALPTLPVCQISGATATVAFAGLNGFAGLYQINLVIPAGAAVGDNPVSCTYGGQTTPPGALVSVQP